MKTCLETYFNTLDKKTLVVFCTDCAITQKVVPGDTLWVHTLFGNILKIANSDDLEYFEYCIEQEGVENIVVAGHYCCGILKNLALNNAANKQYWEAENYVKNLVNNHKSLLRKNPESDHKLIHFHVSEQVKLLSEIGFLDKRINEGRLTISGIIIDDHKNNEVEQVDILYSGIHPVFLN